MVRAGVRHMLPTERGSLPSRVGQFFDRPYWRTVRRQAWTDTRRWLSEQIGTELLVTGVPSAVYLMIRITGGKELAMTGLTTLAVAFGSWAITGLAVFVYN